MADRRMISKNVIQSDVFMDMPLSAQALYMHLLLTADDDGFVGNPRKIQRMVGASNDDLKLLLAKNYVLAYDSGVYVIRHWRNHNYLRKDRYKPSSHVAERSLIRIASDGSYTLCPDDGIPLVDHMATQVRSESGKVRVRSETGKVRVRSETGKVRVRSETGKDNINLSMDDIMEQVDYDNIRTDMTMTEHDILRDVIAVMQDVYKGTSDTIMIGREEYTRRQVIDRFKAIDSSCMRYIVESIYTKAKSISNPRAYILTCLFNAPVTIDTAYIVDINNDA